MSKADTPAFTRQKQNGSFSPMSTATLEGPLSYEEERGKPVPSLNHGAIQTNLAMEFCKNRTYRVVSELTLDISGVRHTPDLSVHPRQALDLRHDVIRATTPPLLTVEIFSPQQGTQEVMDKVDAYFRFGVKSCWIVAPPLRTVRILTADGYEETFHTGTVKDPVTGLTANLEEVFS